MKTPDILLALRPVLQVLEKLDIPYYIGGSLASSLYGIARATMDVDLSADLKPMQVSLLKGYLIKNYYLDEQMILEAIKHKSSFNLIHLATMIKIDVFIHQNEPYQNESLKRRKKDILEGNSNTKFYFASPEDIIIHKLQWYEKGGRTSERQWLDVIGVVKVQGKLLDVDYLRRWASRLGLFDLLKKAFTDSGMKI